jgi:hypothetical protein
LDESRVADYNARVSLNKGHADHDESVRDITSNAVEGRILSLYCPPVCFTPSVLPRKFLAFAMFLPIV